MSKQSERRRRFVRAFAPAVGLLAAGLLVWQGSYAAFSATTTDTGNAWATGTLQLTNNGGDDSTGAPAYSGSTSADFGGSNLTPGGTSSECLTVKDPASLGGNVAMWASNVADDTTSKHDLTDTITVSVDAVALAATDTDITQNCTGFPATGTTSVLAGTALSSFPTSYTTATKKMAIAAGGRVAYKVTWTFTSTGTTAGDNALQGKTASADFTWEVQ